MNKQKQIIFYILLPFFICFYCISSLANDLTTSNEFTINNFINNISIETSSSEKKLQLNSRSCIVLDRKSKQILYGKNEKNKVKMASTTKIMTAIVVLENSSLNQTVEVSKKSAGTGGSRLGLKYGDKITIRDLLYGLLLCSGNDAAVCLAESIAGSVTEFSNLMNSKAQELGLNNSHFESPHGLDSDNHYTTAYELALLSDYALNNSTFRSIVGTKTYTVTINGYPKTLSNTNELLGNLDGVYGIKTGFTNGANRCLVSACKRGNMDIICVVLGADTKNFRTKDSIELINYTFENFEYFSIKNFIDNFLTEWKNNNKDYFFIEKGVSQQLDLKTDSYIDQFPVIPIKKTLIKDINIFISLSSHLQAPVIKDTPIGHLKVYSQDVVLLELDLLSNSNIYKKNILDYMSIFFKSYPFELKKMIQS